jgi:DNA-binding transcriptional ArsR family regulator
VPFHFLTVRRPIVTQLQATHEGDRFESGALLPEDVSVTMPDLPPRLAITTAEQFKAIAEPNRARILGILQQRPATAKELATTLGLAPGTTGHHLQVLEAAGLARVVSRRLVRGIVAKYYARTARIFVYDLPPEVAGASFAQLMLLTQARDELAAATPAEIGAAGFPHLRVTPARAREIQRQLDDFLTILLAEPSDPTGEVYSVSIAMFRAPDYLQRPQPAVDDDE